MAGAKGIGSRTKGVGWGWGQVSRAPNMVVFTAVEESLHLIIEAARNR